MKKDDWNTWLANRWGKSIKRNGLIKVRYKTSRGTRTAIGRIQAATQDELLLEWLRDPLRIGYRRIRSIEIFEYKVEGK